MKKKILIVLIIATLVLSAAALAACGGQAGRLTVEFDTSHVVYEGDTLDSLKPYMTVT